jgi:hypothetical protein
MKIQHTPGPWKVERQYTATNRFPISHKIDAYCSGILAEVTGQGGTETENLANARLIAAAPELLEALGYALRLMEGAEEYGWQELNHGDREQAQKDARAAISKAEGGGQ